MYYHLHPPLFVVGPHISFDIAWEIFCLRLLSLENHTADIRRCAPPDLGIDLIWETRGIIYQCKSTEYGHAINIKKIEQSIQQALLYRETLHWERYVLCTNVTLTGKQQLRLKSFLPEIEFIQRERWADLCKKFHSAIADCFQVPIQLSQERMLRGLNEAYLRDYLQSTTSMLPGDSISLLVYSRRRDYIFELRFPISCAISDILTVLQTLFELPPTEEVKTNGLAITLTYTLFINGHEAPSHKKLSELVSQDEDRPVVTFLKATVWYKTSFEPVVTTELEHTIGSHGGWQAASDQIRDEKIRGTVDAYERKVDASFDRSYSLLANVKMPTIDANDQK